MAVVVRMLLTLAVIGAVAVLPTSAQRQPPHILFIVADDLGWNDVEWRDPKLHTPNLNRFARQGLILNNSYVQPVCTPSRSAFMSGYFPIHTGLQHGVIGTSQNASLPGDLMTLPEALQSQGYVTHMVGKWHLGFCNWKYTPTYRGFDSFLGYYGGAEDYYTHMSGNRHRPGGAVGLDFRKDKLPDHLDTGNYSAHVFEARALDIVSNHDMTKPLFLYLPFQSVHDPLEVPKMYEDQFCSHIKNDTRRTKCGMIAALDEAIGNITSLMEQKGYFDNMLMIFTSDNGGPVWDAGNNWPLRGAKTTLWEGGTRATAFVYSKSLLRNPGSVHEGMIHAVDWFPTIMNLAGGDAPSGIDGINQWESIADGTPSPRTEFVYNMDDVNEFSAAIRMGDWKLIQGSAGRWNDWYPVPDEQGDATPAPEEQGLGPDDYQLFNIKEDPTEHDDVKDKYPDVLAKMKARLSELRQFMVPANNPPSDPASDPKNFGGVWSPGWC